MFALILGISFFVVGIGFAIMFKRTWSIITGLVLGGLFEFLAVSGYGVAVGIYSTNGHNEFPIYIGSLLFIAGGITLGICILPYKYKQLRYGSSDIP